MKQVSLRPRAGRSRIGRARIIAAVILLALGACTPDDVSGPREVRIRIFNSAFVPSEIEVQSGSTVRFVVVNEDPIPHELIIGDATVQVRHEKGTETRHVDTPGEVSVPGGKTATTTYTFGGPRPEILFACHLPGHYDYGMKGRVVID